MTHCRDGGGRGGGFRLSGRLSMLLLAFSQVGVGLAAGCGPDGAVDVLPADGAAGSTGGAGGSASGGRGGGDGGVATGGTGGAGTGAVGGGYAGAGGGVGGAGAGGGTGGEVDAGSPPTPTPDAPVDLPSAPDVVVRPPDMAPRPADMAPAMPDAPAASSLSMGLITRLKLDEGTGTTTADSGGGGNNGTLSGGAMWIRPGAPGTKFNNPAALHFDGGDDFVEVGTRNMRRNNEAQSVAFWVRYTAAPSGARVCVSLTQGAAGEARLKIGFNDGQVRAWKSSSDPLVTTAIPAAGWHHYAYTYDGRIHRLYLDGTMRGMSTTAADNGPAANVRLGAIHNNAENFQGDLDDVRFYDRALTATEITALAAGAE